MVFDTLSRSHYHTAPMPQASKEPLDALRLAATAAVVEGEFPLASFGRLAERLATTDGVAFARMTLGTAGDVPTGELEVRAEAQLSCQRCLGPMRRTLQSTSQLAFVEREDAPAPADYESVPGDPRRVDLAGLVEDELLLSLPLIAIHGAGEKCAARELRDEEMGPAAEEMRRPFARLKELLKN